MSSFKVQIQPKVLKWARESINKELSEVAKTLGVNTDSVISWETGKADPTISKLTKLASVYKRPLAVLLMSRIPNEPSPPRDFRTLPDVDKKPFSSKVNLAIRRAQRIQELSKELNGAFSSSNIKSIEVKDEPYQASKKLRELLTTTVEEQFKWRDEREALREWKQKLENLGILILQFSLPIKELRGFSLIEDNPYVIAINSQDTPRGRIFSLFHEFCHLQLKRSGLCDMRDRNGSSYEVKRIEKFCNHFAGSFLVPQEALLKHPLVKNLPESDWREDVLFKLSNDFKVSQEVILRRLVALKLATEEYYKSKRDEWEINWEKRKLANKKNKSYGLSAAKKCFYENGPRFISLVLKNVNEGKITYRDAADYLNTTAQNLDKVQKMFSL